MKPQLTTQSAIMVIVMFGLTVLLVLTVPKTDKKQENNKVLGEKICRLNSNAGLLAIHKQKNGIIKLQCEVEK